MGRPIGSKSIKNVIAQKRLWENPEYRKHMSEAHKGQKPTNIEQLRKINKGNQYSKGRMPWNKDMKTAVISKDRKDDYRMRRLFRNRMQKQVFERDDYTCQMCGLRGVDIQVDHIQSWADYVELRFSLDNCRTVCVECHYKITFGKPMPRNIKGWGHNLMKGRVTS